MTRLAAKLDCANGMMNTNVQGGLNIIKGVSSPVMGGNLSGFMPTDFSSSSMASHEYGLPPAMNSRPAAQYSTKSLTGRSDLSLNRLNRRAKKSTLATSAKAKITKQFLNCQGL